MVDSLADFQVWLGVAFSLWMNGITLSLLYTISISIRYLKGFFSLTDIIFFAAMLALVSIPYRWYGNSRNYPYWFFLIAFSLGVFVVGILRKNSFVGFPLHFLGVLSNGLVMMVNGFKMPVALEIVDGMVLSETHIFMSAATSLNYLGDWIPYPGPRFVGLFSPGDLLMSLGASVAFIEALAKKRGA
ncbi:MAG: DUF5317 family protein [Candidatus Sungbacteria bacterium]|nr:DUF5317 family protein [Candidatus Sungbacteria bacterium]